MKFTVEVEGTEQLKAEFRGVESTVSDFSPIWKGVQSEFFAIEKEQFNSEGGKGASGNWQALSPAYREIKQKRYGSKPILRATDRLFKSLTGETDDSIAQFGKTEAAFGTRLPYARRHQGGGGRLPRREPISLSDKQKERIVKRIGKELLNRLKKSRLSVN